MASARFHMLRPLPRRVGVIFLNAVGLLRLVGVLGRLE